MCKKKDVRKSEKNQLIFYKVTYCQCLTVLEFTFFVWTEINTPVLLRETTFLYKYHFNQLDICPDSFNITSADNIARKSIHQKFFPSLRPSYAAALIKY